jgi:hypothetical protein
MKDFFHLSRPEGEFNRIYQNKNDTQENLNQHVLDSHNLQYHSHLHYSQPMVACMV